MNSQKMNVKTFIKQIKVIDNKLFSYNFNLFLKTMLFYSAL